MESASRQALKEWAVVDEALARGEVSVLLRKGGIHERSGDFGVEHRAFWIYPTGWHQNPEDLAPRLHPLLDAIAPPPRGIIPFRVFAEVDAVIRIESREALDRIEHLHPLSPAAAHYRFSYRDRPYVHALLVRAHRLPHPVELRETNRYEGCVSWVELDQEIATAGAQPVLSDEAFGAIREELARLV
ncbi:MAG TPA: DUF1802 family protein [Longimicrobium sp.]|nr:DUF1802 family protein [Longimicrobium sp.]